MPAQTDGLDASELFVAGDQRAYIAPVGTAFPADITADPAATWVDLGYTTTDGVKLSFGRDVTPIMSSQSLTTIRNLVTAAPKQVSLTFMQMNADVLMLALGGGTISGPANSGKYLFTPADDSFIDEHALIIEGTDSPDKIRFCYSRVSLADKVEIPLTNTAQANFPLTLEVLAATPTFVIQSNIASWNVN